MKLDMQNMIDVFMAKHKAARTPKTSDMSDQGEIVLLIKPKKHVFVMTQEIQSPYYTSVRQVDFPSEETLSSMTLEQLKNLKLEQIRYPANIGFTQIEFKFSNMEWSKIFKWQNRDEITVSTNQKPE